MNRLLIPLLSLVFFAGALESVVHAGRIPIIWGQGETISDLGELPPTARDVLPKEFGKDATVGYLYSHFHIYYLDLWTWNGRHVLHGGDGYTEIDDAAWNQLLGSSVESKFGTPLLYNFPPGLTLIFSIVVVCCVKPLFFPSNEQIIKKSSKDERYTRALETVFPENLPAFDTTIDPQRFHQAVILLTGQGIPEPKARRNLELLASVTCATRESQITKAFETADHLPAIGEMAESIEILKHLIESLPPSDARREYAAGLLAERQQEAAGAENSGEPTVS